MPKLHKHTLQRNQLRIEEAALRVFTRQGYHGTSVREIADEAKVSLGNIYNYYDNKEEIFASLVERYEERLAALQRKILAPLLGKLDPASLRKLAEAVRRIVYDNPDYWRLMYIDVVEFGNRHFAHVFRDLGKNIARLAGTHNGHRGKPSGGVNPDLAFTAVYLQFFTYYLVEKLFGGREHLGAPERQAIEQLIEIYTRGVGNNGSKRERRRNGI